MKIMKDVWKQTVSFFKSFFKFFHSREDGKDGPGSIVAKLNAAIQFSVLLGAFILLVIVFLRRMECDRGNPIGVFMVAAAAYAAGVLVGLMMAAFGEEKQLFSSLSAAFHGAVGGFTLSDLSKEDGVIKKILHTLASATGNEHEVGLTGAVLVFFGAAGFVTMFCNKQYVLNPLLAKSQRAYEQLEKLGQLIKSEQLGDFSWEREGREEISEERKTELEQMVEKFEGVLDDAELFNKLPVETLRSWAKALRLLGEKARSANQPEEAVKRFEEAAKVLKRARCKAADDVGILLDLINVILLRPGKEHLAVPHCSYLQHLSMAPISAYKLLGYAGLFDYRCLAEAETATRQYLKFVPNDASAKLNLACAIAQQDTPATITTPRREDLFQQLRTAIGLWPHVRSRIMTLTEPGDDFAQWKDDPDFQRLIQ